ncbi:MAG: NAD-dependent epimerase/dehydratase family protein [Gemmatimonadota bacterium]|nr:MAG: NAD-dependent epimerase/dehydratase family protein [Gemmatimonadota bacterium]
MLSDATVLVTGGAGFIGSHIVMRALKENARKVIVIDNFVAGKHKNLRNVARDKKLEIIPGDVRDVEVIQPLVKQSDVVFHEAASKLVVSLKTPRIDLGTNIVGTFNILEAAKGTNVRIIHASTGSVLGSADKPMPENHLPEPTTLYGISKLTAEKYCLFYAREFGVRVSVLRYFHVYGPHQDYHGEAGVVNIFLSRVLGGEPPVIYGTGEQIRCFTYVEDNVDANILVAFQEDTVGEVYNLASRARVTVKDLAEMIIEKYASEKMEPVYAPARQGENLRPIPDTEKIEGLGFKEKMAFEEGLEITKRWIEKDIQEDSYY